MSKMYQIFVFGNNIDFATEYMPLDELEDILEIMLEKFPSHEGFFIKVFEKTTRTNLVDAEDFLK